MRKGFTLVESIIVIAIIATLSVILVPSFLEYIEDSNIKAASSNAKSFETIYNAERSKAIANTEGAIEVVTVLTNLSSINPKLASDPNMSYIIEEDTAKLIKVCYLYEEQCFNPEGNIEHNIIKPGSDYYEK
ncbi:MAG: prepilin-type N-terminal cleavage/methylation domain-containing protein [Erysipelotrichaceae bacterium]